MTFPMSRQDLAACREGTAKKWDLLLQAIDTGAGLTENVARSLGDSLTYWRSTTTASASPHFVAHRRYQTVLAALDSDYSCQIAPARSLTLAKPYSDLADREELLPPTHPDTKRTLTVALGQILLIPIDHAWRVLPKPTASLLVARLTVEGATVHNE